MYSNSNTFQIRDFNLRGAEHPQMRSGFYASRSHLRMLTPPYLKGIDLNKIKLLSGANAVHWLPR